MRALGAIVLTLAIVAGIGFYRGWFSVATNNANASSKFTLTVNNDKIRVDRKAATEKVADIGHDAKDKVAGPGGKDDGSALVSEKNDVSVLHDDSHDGTMVSLGDKLTMKDKAGNEHQHVLAANAEVTCDGKACKATDLKPGMKIRVTTESADPAMVTHIEALDRNDKFENAG